MSSLHAFLNRLRLSMADCAHSCEVTSHPLSFHPQNCCSRHGPFGYTHRHTCARPLYTKSIWIHTVTHTHRAPRCSPSRLFFCWHLQPRCAARSEVLLSAGCFAFPLWNMWGVSVGCPSGCISLCVMGICLLRPLVWPAPGVWVRLLGC